MTTAAASTSGWTTARRNGQSNIQTNKTWAPGASRRRATSSRVRRRQPGQAVLPGLPVQGLQPQTRPAPACVGSFQANALDLYNALSPVYKAVNSVQVTGQDNNQVKGRHRRRLRPRITWKAELAGMPTELVTGVRYETDQGPSRPRRCAVPSNILWTADNDFSIISGDAASSAGVRRRAAITTCCPRWTSASTCGDNLTGRFSFSRTIARGTEYGNLFASASPEKALRTVRPPTAAFR
ncbi:hypothetical protein ACRAWD_03430 [Caulobacter segnis]